MQRKRALHTFAVNKLLNQVRMNLDTKHRSLTKSELHLMNILWDMEQATVKELIEKMPEPRSAYNTVLTVMRVLAKKNVVKAVPQKDSKAHVYIPIMTREEYTTGFMEETRNTLFKGSFSALLSFFAERERLAADEVERIVALLRKNQRPPSIPQGGGEE